MYTPIEKAADFLQNKVTKSPASEDVVKALIAAEKSAKQTKTDYNYSQLVGNWRLGFITGTKKTRKRAGVVLGAGKFLPKLVKIQLSYSKSEDSSEKGNVENSVQFGLLKIVLSGPVQFWLNKNILAFDFTKMQLSLSGLKLYQGYIRGGEDRENSFYQQTLKQQAFFTYFLITDNYIAARGKGGGLALWVRVSEQYHDSTMTVISEQ
ncbi:MAG: hypothetical protein AAFV71_26125 [Cyanobacteria bacterium J06633_8]